MTSRVNILKAPNPEISRDFYWSEIEGRNRDRESEMRVRDSSDPALSPRRSIRLVSSLRMESRAILTSNPSLLTAPVSHTDRVPTAKADRDICAAIPTVSPEIYARPIVLSFSHSFPIPPLMPLDSRLVSLIDAPRSRPFLPGSPHFCKEDVSLGIERPDAKKTIPRALVAHVCRGSKP